MLKDDDGKIYLYTGLSYLKDAPMRKFLAGKYQIDGSYCVELEKDMLTLKSEPVLAVPGEVHIEPGICALYFTYRGSGSIDWQWFEFCGKEK